ncbi:unnamed protein product [Linum trigynum]|uniref:Uncharacterized protein n=1 Tax=Linum trigynum TaxID=586398 RepID=A0AAV2GWJ0_9ROSI
MVSITIRVYSLQISMQARLIVTMIPPGLLIWCELGTWFSNNHGIFHYGLPTPLLNYLRKARDHMPNTTTIKKEDMEVDIEVLQDLVTTFNSMMENLGDTTSDYGEDCERWDIKLAVEFKEGQRRIISSILSSCDDGIRLLQTHLQKCTS